jgi:hypothetical protein
MTSGLAGSLPLSCGSGHPPRLGRRSVNVSVVKAHLSRDFLSDARHANPVDATADALSRPVLSYGDQASILRKLG